MLRGTILKKARASITELTADTETGFAEKPVPFEAIIHIIDGNHDIADGRPPLLLTNQFASALAHEVRNPLSNISMAVKLLMSSEISAEQKLYLDIIMRGSGRINSLITDLLTSFHDDDMLSAKHSIHQLLDDVLVMNADRIMLKNIHVSKHYTTLDCRILGNKEKIKIALTNIIINAIDAMPPDGGELKLLTKSMNGNCIIEIQDNGIGISKENLLKIFNPYFTDKPGGMGLGLSTTMDILSMNNCKVDVQSEPGKGTRFILSFDRLQTVSEITT